MAKKKTTTTKDKAPDQAPERAKGNAPIEDSKPVKKVVIDRTGHTIDPSTVVEVQELSKDEVMVITAGHGSYRLTRDEAKPFMDKLKKD